MDTSVFLVVDVVGMDFICLGVLEWIDSWWMLSECFPSVSQQPAKKT